jgi:hypothetical protein
MMSIMDSVAFSLRYGLNFSILALNPSKFQQVMVVVKNCFICMHTV